MNQEHPAPVFPDMLTSYKGLTLDKFQIEAIEHLLAGRSVLVSAPTGAGKTLIADYLIEHVIAEGGRAIYTAPIKALSNQKYKDFKRQYGQEKVGIVTGDVVINDAAPILVMTTEILRNIVHTEPGRLDHTSHVIFDEIHYIGDEERGSVWEEAVIFLPHHIRILGLSATIPNASELAAWMSQARDEEVKVVKHLERPVPLAHYLFEKQMGAGTLQDLIKFQKAKWDELTRSKARRHRHRRSRWKADEAGREDFYDEYNGDWEGGRFRDFYLFPTTTHLDLIKYLVPDLLPCLYFLFSRQQCEIKAQELAARRSFLDGESRHKVAAFFDEKVRGLEVEGFPKTQALRQVLMRGIGFHHAGLLPILKEIVEELFAARKISVLYCTETFAVGVNLPVRSVCFDSPEKFDGISYRPMTHQEYFQMAGRAGRRGIDKQGYVFTLVDLNYFRKENFPVYEEKKIEDLRSRFKLSYNTVLNLVARYDRNEIRTLLGKSFAAYQRRKAARTSEDRGELMAEFAAKVRLLQRLGYIDPSMRLTDRGAIASRINVQELLVTELLCDGFFHELDEDRVNALAVAIDYEPRRDTPMMIGPPFDPGRVNSVIHRIKHAEHRELGYSTVVFDPHLSGLAYLWSLGMNFADLVRVAHRGAGALAGPGTSANARALLERADVSRASVVRMIPTGAADEGDIVSCFRRGIDLLRQIRLASEGDQEFVRKINRCMDKMDRDVVRVNL